MAQPHTFTPNYNLLKIGLGSNAFDNPYHVLYADSMDIIDAQLWADKQFRDSLSSTGTGFVSRAGGAFTAAEPLRLHQQAGWHTNDSVQASSDIGQHPFSGGLTTTALAGGYITLFPFITGFPSTLRHGIYITSGSSPSTFRLALYSSDSSGYPYGLIDYGNYFISAEIDLPQVVLQPSWQYGVLEDALQGHIFWMAIVRPNNGSITVGAANRWRTFGGCNSSGNFGSSIVAPFSSWPPPSQWSFNSSQISTAPPPMIFRAA